MVKGGYQIINLDGVIHTLGLGMVHEGIYERIEGTQKPIMISGININGFDYHDCYVEPKVNGSNYEFEMYGYNVTINDVDVVTVIKTPSSSINSYDLGEHDFSTGPSSVDEETYAGIQDNISNIPFKVAFVFNGRRSTTIFTAADVADGSVYGLTSSGNVSLRAYDNEITISVV